MSTALKPVQQINVEKVTPKTEMQVVERPVDLKDFIDHNIENLVDHYEHFERGEMIICNPPIKIVFDAETIKELEKMLKSNGK